MSYPFLKQGGRLLLAASLLSLGACHNGTDGTTDKTAAKDGRKLLDPANMDTTVKPGENFYQYANGTWLKNNPIPGDQTRWGSFNQLAEDNYKKEQTLMEDASKANAAAGSAEQRVGDFYKSGMDTATMEKAGIAPLKESFDRINAITDANGVLHELALEQTMGTGGLFSFGISPDDKQVTKEIAQFQQGGLGLPDRDYYFNKDPRTTGIRDAYKVYLTKVFTLMGEDSTMAKKDAADEYAFEEKLAGASMDNVTMRDPYKVYHKFAVADFNKATPGIDWKVMFTDLKIANQDTCLVGQPGFFAAMAKELKATPLPVWKKYMQAHLLIDMSGFMGSAYNDARFDFYGKTLSGQKQQKPRWQRVMRVVDGSIGDLLGKMYVDKYFKPEAKKRMEELVNNLQQTYADRIKRLDWMSDSTKTKALAKLNGFMKKIGYGENMKKYEGLTVGNDYVKNIMAANQWEYNYSIAKLGKPVDKTEWGMTPPTVNAYYNPAFNEIVFPAGILQYPFFSDDADDALNYGGIGAVIGHEMTHGFDDQGRQYDLNGNLHDWWGPADSKNFLQKAGMVVTQFNNYTVLDTVHVNGQLTEGENLADLGGVNIAYEAFMKTPQAKEGKKIDGFTPQQRFFLSWAQVWREKSTPESLAMQVKTNPHSPEELRCNGPLSNMQEFYDAFGIKQGDKMWRAPEARAKVW